MGKHERMNGMEQAPHLIRTILFYWHRLLFCNEANKQFEDIFKMQTWLFFLPFSTFSPIFLPLLVLSSDVKVVF